MTPSRACLLADGVLSGGGGGASGAATTLGEMLARADRARLEAFAARVLEFFELTGLAPLQPPALFDFSTRWASREPARLLPTAMAAVRPGRNIASSATCPVCMSVITLPWHPLHKTADAPSCAGASVWWPKK